MPTRAQVYTPAMSTNHNTANAHHAQEATSSSTIVAPIYTVSRQPTNYSETDTPTGPEVPPVIPDRPKKHCRTLVLCFDGTGDQFQNDNSNVVQFVSMLMKEDSDKQLVYYQASPY